MTIDTAALRAKLRVYDQTLPRCTKRIVRVSNHAPDYIAEEERASWEMRLTYPCAELEGHDGPCREGRAILGWPGFATVTALLDGVDRLRADNERLQAEVDELRAREAWLEKAVEVTDAARCDDRTAVVAFLHACGYDAAAEAVAKAGFPLWACLPLVSPEAIRNSGEHTP